MRMPAARRGPVSCDMAAVRRHEVEIPLSNMWQRVAQVKSVFAARQRYWRGDMTKFEFNRVVAQSVMAKWVPLAKETQPSWRWLAELSAYLELKFLGIE